MSDPLRIHGQNLQPPTVDGLREAGFVVDDVPAGPVDAVLLEANPEGDCDLSSLAMLRLEHPDSLLLLASPPPPPRRLIEWVRAGLDDWVDAGEGVAAIARSVQASVQRRELALRQRAVMSSLEDRRIQAATEERELSERLVTAATELESEHRRLGAAHSNLQNRVAQLVMLYRIGRNLSSHSNWDEALAELLDQMNRFLGSEGVALLLRSQGGRRLAARSVCGLSPEAVDEMVGVLEPIPTQAEFAETLIPLEAMREGELTSCADCRTPFSHTVIPLTHRGRDLGCLVMAKHYADGVAFADDYYFLVTIRTVVAEEVASAQAVHELRRLQQFQERTLAQLATGILTVDDQGAIGLANRTALGLLGVDGVTGVDLDRQLRLGAESPPLRRWLAGLGEPGSATVDAWVHPAGGGEVVPVSLVASTLPAEVPGESQYVCVLEDGRERRALESERRRAARQKELLIMAAEWAHDVRTPLTGILHSAELLAGAAPPDRAARHFEVIRGEVERINELVNNFLDYARPAELRSRDHDLAAVVGDAVELMEALTAEKGCRLRLSADPVEAAIDRDQFRQVLLNLITNAIDAAPANTEVRVSVARDAGSAPARGVIEVSDAGAGVNSADIDRLFIPFFTTKPEGTGLGLAISEKIIRAHGGTLRYERVGGRTVFRIVLPVSSGAGAGGQQAEKGLQAKG